MGQIIALLLAIVTGVTLLLQYLLGDKRQLRILKARLIELEDNLAIALSKNDTVSISLLSIELDRVRKKISERTNGK